MTLNSSKEEYSVLQDKMLLLWSPLQSAEKKVPKLIVCDSWEMVAVTHWSHVIQNVNWYVPVHLITGVVGAK